MQAEGPGNGGSVQKGRTFSVWKFRSGILHHHNHRFFSVPFPGNFPFGMTTLVFLIYYNQNFQTLGGSHWYTQPVFLWQSVYVTF